MAEDINDILGVNSPKSEANGTANQNVVPKESNVTTEQSDDNSAENTLNTIAWITLIVGIIAALICLFTVCWTTTTVVTQHYTYIPDETKDVTTFNPMGFAMTIGIFLSSLASWAFLRVISNISLTLKDIRKKTK